MNPGFRTLSPIDADGPTLIGVVHRDPLGTVLLSQCLEALQPGAVCVEFSPLGLLWREQRSNALLARLDAILSELPGDPNSHPQVQLIRTALELPFEYRCAVKYAQKHNASVHIIDLNRLSRAHLPLFESEILTTANIRALLSEQGRSLSTMMENAYRRAHWHLTHDKESPVQTDTAARQRERFLACRIRSVLQCGRPAVFVGGWEHLRTGDRCSSLAVLLSDRRTGRILLRGGDLS